MARCGLAQVTFGPSRGKTFRFNVIEHLAVSVLCCLAWASTSMSGKAQVRPEPLDPARDASELHAPVISRLPEEYIWTAGDVTARRPDHSHYPWNRTDLRAEPHVFRREFHLDRLPAAATVYIAGPRWARVFLNGKLLGEFSTNVDQPINFRVFHANAGPALREGDNVLAVEAIRGRGVVSASASVALQQLAYGEVLAAKVVAGVFGDESAPELVASDAKWRSQPEEKVSGSEWRDAGFQDASWPTVESLGPVEGNIDFFQWSADAGMYGWPGYRGMSPWLRNQELAPVAVTHVFQGEGSFDHVEALSRVPAAAEFAVHLREPAPTDADAPSLLLDFGREVAGRLLVRSKSSSAALLSIAYGESELEAMATGITPGQRGGNYLGTNLLEVPANGVARGPKSAFRYVRIRFLRGAPDMTFGAIGAELIAYPVHYQGSFESSDPVLNQIWETGAYTVHLCMQDDIWDAPKRDRGRWVGDLDVEARTILSAFGDKFLIEDTLRRLAEGTGPGQPVNGIASYTAQWVTTLATLYLRTGDAEFVRSQHDALVRDLETMQRDLDPATGLLKASAKGWGFVDWAPGLYGNTPETQSGTTLLFLRAFEQAPALLRAAGDEANAKRYEEEAQKLRQAAAAAYMHAGSAGKIWQINALAVLTRLDPAADATIWKSVFATVKQNAPTDPEITPYFNAYLIDAMGQTGHRRETLDWIRAYWGGMLAEGATSLWEAYDLRWPKVDYHLSLAADGTNGYFVSLAHGWSSGPVTWLSENILGVRPSSPGYRSLELHPDLMGLQFARGTVPTPYGVVTVSMDAAQGLTLDLPKGIESARLFLPAAHGAEPAPIQINHSGHFHFALQ